MDLATLALKVDHSQVDNAGKSLDGMKSAATRTEAVTKGLHQALGGFGTSLIGTSAIIGGATAVIIDMVKHTEEMRHSAQNMAHAHAASGGTAQALAQNLRSELEAVKDLTQANTTGIHSMDRMEVMKAKLYALGPDYRKMIDDEVMSYDDLLKVIDKVNVSSMKRVELQIQEQERQVKKSTKPGWMTGIGMAAASTAGLGGVGNYLWSRGIDADLLKVSEENKRLDSLYKDRAILMDKSEFKAAKTKSGSLSELDRELKLVQDLVYQRDKLALSGEALIQVELQHRGIVIPGLKEQAAELLRVIGLLETVKKFSDGIAKADAIWLKKYREPKEVNQNRMDGMFSGFQVAQDLGDPFRWEREQLQDQGIALERWKNTMPIENYTHALETLRLKDLQLRAAEGNTWAIIGQTVVMNANLGTDALQRWMNNTDQLGRTWQSLGQTFRNVLHDMVLQMQRAIIQQKLMQPLMTWAGVGISNLFGGPAAGSTNYVGSGAATNPFVGAGGFTGTVPGLNSMQSIGKAQGGAQTSIVINNTGGAATSSSQGTGQNGAALGKMIESAVMGVMVREKRPGGLLAGA